MKLTKRLSRVDLLMVMVAIVGSAIVVHAGTINSSWNGGTGNWNVATDWIPNGVPNNGGGNIFNVTIDSSGTDLVTLNQNATIASLVLGGTTGSSTLQNLSGTAENLSVTGAATINGTGTLTFANASILFQCDRDVQQCHDCDQRQRALQHLLYGEGRGADGG